MTAAYVTVMILTIVANAGAAVADFTGAASVRKNSAELGIPESWIPPLGFLKAAGAVGLLVGLAGIPSVGVAAGIGLMLFFIGAVIVHIRARVFHNIAAPLTFFILATAASFLAAWSALAR
jgi:DoxX-like family